MGTSKHTPGPWEVVALNGFGPFAIRMGTPKGTGHPTHYGVGQIGTEANARLIAAAPELLAGLKALISELPNYMAKSKAVSEASAAIAKAEGRS